jgi:hypothetical protein
MLTAFQLVNLRKNARSMKTGHNGNAILVRNDHVARVDEGTTTSHRSIYTSEANVRRTSRENAATPERESQLTDDRSIADQSIDNRASNPPNTRSKRHKGAPNGNRVAVGNGYYDVAWTAHSNRAMEGQVVSWGTLAGDGRS